MSLPWRPPSARVKVNCGASWPARIRPECLTCVSGRGSLATTRRSLASPEHSRTDNPPGPFAETCSTVGPRDVEPLTSGCGRVANPLVLPAGGRWHAADCCGWSNRPGTCAEKGAPPLQQQPFGPGDPGPDVGRTLSDAGVRTRPGRAGVPSTPQWPSITTMICDVGALPWFQRGVG